MTDHSHDFDALGHVLKTLTNSGKGREQARELTLGMTTVLQNARCPGPSVNTTPNDAMFEAMFNEAAFHRSSAN